MADEITHELFSRLWHGADYNYEQWLAEPEVLREDFRLMGQARCTAMSIGIFSWAMLEPADGQYRFDWLDRLMDDLHAHGVRAILATPSAAHPAWLSEQHPEVQRMHHDGRREPHGGRQNFCRTSPVFREKCLQINTRLAERYQNHPALLMWHVSNEYGSTPCYCPTCLDGFRTWLQARYGDLESLNRAWWTTFWSHRYGDWSEIRPVDASNNGLMLDWQRYLSDQVLDFYRAETAPLRRLTPHIPVTTNFMRPDVGLDYWKFAEEVDVICWDSYPEWHVHDDVQTAVTTAFYHDLHRSYKRKPFYLIESSPAQTNWQPLSRLKRPGMVKLASAQALAHGAMGVNYFQWRQSRGGEEKFHGAVVLHRGGEETRTFREVRSVGEMLAGLPDLAAAETTARVAIVYDYENEWALNRAYLPRKAAGEYQAECIRHYAPFWKRSAAVSIVSARSALDGFALVIAPILHLLTAETAARLARFVESGGVLVTTCLTGWVGESDLVHPGGYPEPLGEVLGLRMTEFDTFGADPGGQIECVTGNSLGLAGKAAFGRYAELLEPLTAETLARYAGEFYAGTAALTANRFGAGRAIHLGAQVEDSFLQLLYGQLIGELGIEAAADQVPDGVFLRSRRAADREVLFALNFNPSPAEFPYDPSWQPLDGESRGALERIPAYGVRLYARPGR